MHPASDHPNCMENYVVHVGKYDFSSLFFPVPLSSIASFATKNDLSIMALKTGRRRFTHFVLHKKLFQEGMWICCCALYNN